MKAHIRVVSQMHKMKNKCMALKEIANELEQRATPPMIYAEVPRKPAERLRLTVLNVREINQRFVSRFESAGPNKASLSPSGAVVSSMQAT